MSVPDHIKEELIKIVTDQRLKNAARSLGQWAQTANPPSYTIAVDPSDPDNFQFWPKPPAWTPADGLTVWDGDTHYVCQAYRESNDPTIRFVCGKCGVTRASTSKRPVIEKPGDVCPECFSVAVGRDAYSIIFDEYMRLQQEMIGMAMNPPSISMAKDAFAKVCPPKP